jgi:hypothetical protein
MICEIGARVRASEKANGASERFVVNGSIADRNSKIEEK